MGRPDSELYRGARLSRTLEWRDRAHPDLNDTEAAFLAASVALSETELRAAETRIAQERKVNRRLRGALAGVGVLLVLTLVAGVVAVRTADQARTEPGPRREPRPTWPTPGGPAPRHPARGPRHGAAARGRRAPGRPSPQAWENLGRR